MKQAHLTVTKTVTATQTLTPTEDTTKTAAAMRAKFMFGQGHRTVGILAVSILSLEIPVF
jgi:hypothetical protein